MFSLTSHRIVSPLYYSADDGPELMVLSFEEHPRAFVTFEMRGNVMIKPCPCGHPEHPPGQPVLHPH